MVTVCKKKYIEFDSAFNKYVDFLFTKRVCFKESDFDSKISNPINRLKAYIIKNSKPNHLKRLCSGFTTIATPNINENECMYLEDDSDRVLFSKFPKQQQEKYKEENSILILMAFSFSVSEIIEKFHEFIQTFDKLKEYKYDFKQINKLLKTYSKDDHLGYSRLSEMFETLGIKPKESKRKKINENEGLDPITASIIFDNLCEEGCEYAQLDKLGKIFWKDIFSKFTLLNSCLFRYNSHTFYIFLGCLCIWSEQKSQGIYLNEFLQIQLMVF